MATLSRRSGATADAKRRRERELLRAAADLVDEGTAFAELAVEAIASRAGVSRQTFYAYFADKRALALALGETLSAEIAKAADPWLSEGEGELRTTLEGVLEIIEANRGAVLALVEAAGYDEEVGAFWRRLHDRFMEPTVTRLRRLGVEGRTAEARAYVLVWATERNLIEHLIAPRVERSDLLDALELFWSAADPVDEGPKP